MSLKVSIKNKTTLVLEENGKQGDEINLLEITNIDTREIEKKIDEKRDEIYKKKLEENESLLKSKYELEKTQLDKKLRDEYQKEIEELNKKVEVLNSGKEKDLKIKEQEVENKYKDLISSLNKSLEKAKSDKEIEILELKALQQKELFSVREELNILKNQKASFGSKMTGENLEKYCNNLYEEASQNGFNTCKWYKDNKVLQNEDELKGSKADYIFEIYATEDKKEEDLLTSVCLEMKDENPDSKVKKTNEDYYKQLDLNRKKKNCKYALLVSNLDLSSSNDLPIKKVKEYQDMYVVRPGYMMTFLNMLLSLTTKFQELYVKDYEENEKIKSDNILMEEFEALKKTYLDNPLEQLKNKIEKILKQTENIKKANEEIEKECDNIIDGYVRQINDKLEKFDIKIEKSYKKNKK